jgi:hypothetical protein
MDRFIEYQNSRRDTDFQETGAADTGVNCTPKPSPRGPIRIKEEVPDENDMFFAGPASPRSPDHAHSSSGGHGSDVSSAPDSAQQPAWRPRTPPPDPPRQAVIDDLPPPECDCSIHLQCPIRGNHLLDCRYLVPEMLEWQGRQREINPWECVTIQFQLAGMLTVS